MKIRLSPSDAMRIDGMKGLNDLVPEGFEGKAVNYGQGEGQIRIENTEWGFYCGPDGAGYSIVFEEGSVDFERAVAMAAGILKQIRKRFGSDISAQIEGTLSSKLGGWDAAAH